MEFSADITPPKDETETMIKIEEGFSRPSIPVTANGLGSASAPIVLFKKEEEDDEGYGKIDRSLPAAPEDNMFMEVDGEDDDDQDDDEDELVDLTYEGIAHVNGVRHFVCEGFKIRQIPEPFIVKRSLLHLFRELVDPQTREPH